MARKWWVLIATGLAGALVSTDFSIVNVCLARIQAELNSDVNQLQWIITGFGLTFCSLLVAAGRLGDAWGRRKILYIGIIGFGLTSMGAGAAQTIYQLIFMRFLQGVFGAIVFPCGMAITANVFPENEHGRALGIYGSIIGIGLAAGPVLGGMIVHFLSWRWVFFINIPAVLISLTISLFYVPESRLEEKISIDWLGVVLIGTTLAALVFAISQSPEYGWTSTEVWPYLLFSVISGSLLIFVERKVKMPLLPINLFANQGFFVGNIIYIAGVALSWAVIFFAPLYLQVIQQYTAFATGFLLLPMTIATAVVPTLSGYFLDKYGRRVSAYSALGIIILALIGLSLFNTESSIIIISLAFILFGIGWGTANGIAMPIALSSLEDTENAGLVSGATITILNVFGVLALAITTTIFRNIERHSILFKLKQQQVTLSESQIHLVHSLLVDPDNAKTVLSGLPEHLAQQIIVSFQQSFVDGYRAAMLTLLLASIAAFIAIYFGLRKK